MTLIEQIQAQKALMESKGAIGLRLEIGDDAWPQVWPEVKPGQFDVRLNGMPCAHVPNMEGFAILATWPEPQT